MYRERLRQLFSDYDPDIQTVIAEVLRLEQEHITMDRPRLKEPIDEIVDQVAKKKLGLGKKSSAKRD
jgi:hypothetical protein